MHSRTGKTSEKLAMFAVRVYRIDDSLNEGRLLCNIFRDNIQACTDPLRLLRERVAKPCAGEGLAKLALDCVLADQSDFTEVIRSNFIHSLRGRVCV